MKKSYFTPIPYLFIVCLMALIFNIPVLAADTDTNYIEESKTIVSTNANIDQDALLEGFMHKQGYSGTSPKVRNSKRRASLSGVNGDIYDVLKAEVTKIANGKSASSSIAISLSLKDLMGNKWKDKFTANDLGVSALLQADYSMTPEALKAITDMLNYDPETVVNALRFDCPYEMYWFGNNYQYLRSGLTYTYDIPTTYISFNEDVTITFNLYVSADYSANGQEKTTDVNVGKCKSVIDAATKANQIISNNAGKSDYEKLKAYNDTICELTSYNNPALAPGIPYGDPWQLIYVFDGNPSTKVVCEGYSKAFKYLCDGSTFNNKLIECYIVSGLMKYGSAADDHMWNLVRMDDGKYYLVDVTNCDEGSIGYKYKLFLAGGKASSGSNWIKANNVDAYYSYDADTKSMYSTAELTLSENNYVKSEPVVETYVTVTYDANDGNTPVTTSKVLAGQKIGTLPTLSRTNFKFDGWYTQKNGGSKVTESYILNDNITLYAHWSGSSVNVYYVVNDDIGTYFVRYLNYGDAYGEMPKVTRNGYTLTGWFTANEGGSKVTPDTIINNANAHSLYARWSKDTYTIYFDANGGTVNESYRNKAYGENYGELPVPTRSSYDFVGWYDSKNGGNMAYPSDIAYGSKNLYAHWSPAQKQADNTRKSDKNSNNDSNTGNNNSTYKGWQPDNSNQNDKDTKAAELPVGSIIKLGGKEYKVIARRKVAVTSITNKKAKTVKIPETIKYKGKTYKVTEIKNGAFSNMKKLTKASIGYNIKIIGKDAFNGCTNLRNITIDAYSLKTIGAESFDGIKKNAKITILCKNQKTFKKLVKALKKAGAKNATYEFIFKIII